MKTIGNKTKQIGGGDTGQRAQDTTSSSSTGWRTPWWIFNCIKFLTSLSPTLGRVLGFLVAVTAWLIDTITIILKTFSAGILTGILRMFWIMLILGLAVAVGYKAINYNFGVSRTEITWQSIVIPLIIIAVLGYVVYRVIKNREEDSKSELTEDATPTPDTKTPSEKKTEKDATLFETWWVKGRLIPVVVCFILIHYAIYQLFPGFWWNNIFTWKSFGLQLAMLIAISVKPQDEKKPGKYKLSTFATFLLFITLVVSVTIGNVEAGITQTKIWFETNLNKEKALGTRQNTANLGRTLQRFDEECAARASEVNTTDKAHLIESTKTHPMFVPLACRESAFNQTERGTSEVLRGKVDRNDLGIMQISCTYHCDKAKSLGPKYDLMTFDGNVNYSKHLYDNEGVDHWFPIVSGRQYDPISTTIMATEDTWSPVIKIPTLTKRYSFVIQDKETVLALIDGKEVKIDPKLGLDYGSIKTVQFKSIKGTVKITIPMEFWPVP